MIFLAALSLHLLLSSLPAAGEAPPLFAKLGFAEAQAKARAESRFLLVDFTASWCAPCKQMDQQTWIDPQLRAWVERRALAVQIDLDAEPELARALDVRSVPTIVVFRGEEEFDRLGGFREPAELIAWLEGVDRGKRLLDRLRKQASSTDAAERHELAKALLERRANADALPHYLWLWDHGLERDPDYSGVRLSYWAAEIGELCRRLPEARAVFSARRDAAFALWSQDLAGQHEAARDWVALHAQLRDREQTLRWYEAVRGEPRWENSLQELREDIYAAYLDKQDYRAAGVVRGWPLAHAEQLVNRYRAALAGAGEERERSELAAQEFHRAMAALYAAMLACEQESWAETVARAGLAADDSAALRIAFAAEALRAQSPRHAHRVWLDEAERAGGEVALLRAELQRALDAKR